MWIRVKIWVRETSPSPPAYGFFLSPKHRLVSEWHLEDASLQLCWRSFALRPKGLLSPALWSAIWAPMWEPSWWTFSDVVIQATHTGKCTCNHILSMFTLSLLFIERVKCWNVVRYFHSIRTWKTITPLRCISVRLIKSYSYRHISSRKHAHHTAAQLWA